MNATAPLYDFDLIIQQECSRRLKRMPYCWNRGPAGPFLPPRPDAIDWLECLTGREPSLFKPFSREKCLFSVKPQADGTIVVGFRRGRRVVEYQVITHGVVLVRRIVLPWIDGEEESILQHRLPAEKKMHPSVFHDCERVATWLFDAEA